MSARRLLLSLLVAVPAAVVCAEEAMPTKAHEMLKARLAEEAKTPKPAPAPAQPAAPTAASTGTGGTEANPIVATAAPVPPNGTSTATTKPRSEPATVLPKVEVRKGRITELDQKLAKQEQDIAREKKNTKPSEVDKALNDSKLAKPLAIFGGESAQFRQHVSSERVSLMEDEKDLIEAIAHAKTKEEKAELQKQLDFLRAERRELEKALR